MRLAPLPNPLDEPVLAGATGSGLRLVVDPRPGWVHTELALGVEVGSIDRHDGTGRPVPAGVAHFLEHDLFEDEAGDVSDRFAALGASCNAFTGHVGTTYVASTTADPLPVADLLLDFVQEASFGDEQVARERQVIAQEIRMYDDDPDWCVLSGLLGAMYARHPVRDQIAGTEESIAAIDAGTLRRCHGRFYGPESLCLVVSGPVDPVALADRVAADQAGRSGGAGRPVRPAWDEPGAVASPRHELALPVARPRFLLGIKETVLGGGSHEVARRRLLTRLALDALFGRASSAYQRLYAEGLVDETFSASYSCEDDFGFTLIGGDTDAPERLEEALRERLRTAVAEGIDRAVLRRARHRLLGAVLKTADALDMVVMGLLAEHVRGLPPFSALGLLESITADDLHARLVEHLRDEAIAVSVVTPAAP